jgi:hypothetical protein
VTFEAGDIVEWVYHPLDPTLVGTLAEIKEVAPPGDIVAAIMTSRWTEAWYDVIDCRGIYRGARLSWLRQAPPVEIKTIENLETLSVALSVID